MSGRRSTAGSLDEIRAGIAERLRARLPEMEQAIYARIQSAVPDRVGSDDPEYQAGLRAAVTAVVVYSLEAIERGTESPARPIPAAAAAQARRAARAGVSLGTVMRRYVAGHGELGEFLMSEARTGGLSVDGPALDHLRRTRETVLERITAAIESEYNDERENDMRSPEQRQCEIVRQLLAGESADSAMLAELDYEFHTSWHVGVVAIGEGAKAFLARLRADFGRRLLPVWVNGALWAWIGGPRMPTASEVERLSVNGDTDLSAAIGEPGRGIEAWRLTHHQAHAALGVALRTPGRFARYADNRLLAVALQNETLARSLLQKYMAPLSSQKDGETLRKTLRVYLDLEANASSAAHTLKVGRKAVKGRVHRVEKLIGCCLHECLAELEVALRLYELDCPAALAEASSTS